MNRALLRGSPSLLFSMKFFRPGNQAINRQGEEEDIQNRDEFYVQSEIQADANTVYAKPENPRLDFPVRHKGSSDKAHHRRGRINIRIGGLLGEQRGQPGMNPAHRESQNNPARNDYHASNQPAFAGSI